MALKAKQDDAPKIEGRFDDTPQGWASYWQYEFKAAREENGEEWPGISAWQDSAKKVIERYRDNRKKSRKPNDARINIFPANVQTQRAILVGNTPKCEVSRAHEDQADDDARVAADILERILNLGLERESSGFAATISKCTEDRLLPGMCGSRVQFDADMAQIAAVPAKIGPCPACQGRGVTAPPPMPAPMMGGPVPPAGQAPGMMGSPGVAGPPMQGAPPMMSPSPVPCPQCQGTGQVELAPEVPAHEEPANEKADAVYVNWRDQLWSMARTEDEIRWWAFGADLSRKQLVEMFEEGAAVPLNVGGKGSGKDSTKRRETPWSRARVWEVWSKEYKRVFWYVEGHPQTLTNKDNPTGEDPLGLDDFWPFPVPMMANATTDAFLPTPDYKYAEDLYNEADDLTARIRGIVRAIKVAGVYDKTNSSVRRLLDEACELELLPVADWSVFLGQKGGLAGAMQLLPVQEMVQTVQALVQERNLVIEAIYQITGLGDIIRGQQQQSETATTSAIKARFASVRLQDLQKEVARYATDLQRLRKEVIAKHWSIKTIIERSAIMQSAEATRPDGPGRIMRAAQLIKDRHLDFRVVIKPEQISLQDWAQLKQQRSEVLQGLGGFFNSMAPLFQLSAQGGPQAIQSTMKFALGAAQWLVAGMPGSSGVEGAFDAFVADIEKLAQQAMSQPPQPPKPDPKVMAQQLKNQGEMQKTQAHTQGRMVEIAAETQADMAKRQQDAQLDVATHNATSEAKLRLDALRSVDQVTGGMR